MKKRYVLFLVICLACMLLSVAGCTRGNEDNAGGNSGGKTEDMGTGSSSDGKIGAADSQGQDEITATIGGGMLSAGNMGLFYRDEDDMLHFTDAQTGRSSIVCDRANCAHEPHRKNEDTECKADVYAFESTIQQGQSMYLLGKDKEKDYSNYRIYRQDLNGDNREQVAELPDTMHLVITGCQANEAYLVMECQQVTASSGEGQVEKDGEEKSEISGDKLGILVYEWKTGKFSRCILSEEKLDQVSKVAAIAGMTFGEDGFSVCLMCQDTGFDLEKANKLPDDKRVDYMEGHMNVHYVAFQWDDPEKIVTDHMVLEGGCLGMKYSWNRLYFMDMAGNLFLTDLSEGEKAESQNIVLKDVKNVGKDTLIQLGAIDPEGRLYYTVTKKETRQFYYYDPAAQESFLVCDGLEFTMEGGSSDYMVLADTSKEKITFHQLSFEDFRETGLEKLGGSDRKK